MPAQLDLTKYLNADLFQELHLDRLTPEARMAFLEKIGEVVNMRIVLRLMEELNDGQKNKLEALLNEKSGDNEALQTFLAKEVPGFESIAQEEVALYKKTLMDRVKA